MTLSAWNVSVIIILYLAAIAAGHFVVGPIVSHLWKRYLSGMERHEPLPAIVGAIDIVLFISAWLLSGKEFIAVWLAIKFVGDWTPSKEEVDRPLHHIFLIGNALNIMISVGAALIIQALLRP